MKVRRQEVYFFSFIPFPAVSKWSLSRCVAGRGGCQLARPSCFNTRLSVCLRRATTLGEILILEWISVKCQRRTNSEFSNKPFMSVAGSVSRLLEQASFFLLCGIFIRLVLLTAILPRREYRTHIALFVSPLSHLASQREISRPNESTSKPSLR